jgi:hypothetical protein
MKPIPLLVLALSTAAPAAAKDLLQQFVVEGGGERVASLGDLDQDGTPDFAIGAAGNGIAAFVFSGKYGYGMFSLPDLGSDGIPSLAAAGDVDGDGTPDVAVGFLASDAHAAAVFSGIDGSLLRAIANPAPGARNGFGHRVVGIGDVDGDGRGDLVVTSPFETAPVSGGSPAASTGRARVYSGASGALLHTVDASFAGQEFGIDAAPLGDVDGDGVPDFVVGSRREAAVVSGAAGAVLRVHSGTPGENFGFAVCSAGDADFDGVPDVAIGAPDSVPSQFGSLGPFGRVFVYSGRTGKHLHDTSGGITWGSRFGTSLAPLPEKEDGLARLLVGSSGTASAPNPVLGSVTIVEIGGNHTYMTVGEFPGDGTGHVIAGSGDVNEDGAPDILVSRFEIVSGVPRYVVRQLSSRPLGLRTNVVNVDAANGGVQQLEIEGLEIVPFSYEPVEETVANRPYVILGSASGPTPGISITPAMHLPLNFDAYFVLTAQTLGANHIVGGLGWLDAAGNADATLVVPPLAIPSLFGIVLHHAVVVFDGPGFGGGIRGVSNAAPIRLADGVD